MFQALSEKDAQTFRVYLLQKTNIMPLFTSSLNLCCTCYM